MTFPESDRNWSPESTDLGLKETERRDFPNDNMFYENKNMGNNSVSVSD